MESCTCVAVLSDFGLSKLPTAADWERLMDWLARGGELADFFVDLGLGVKERVSVCGMFRNSYRYEIKSQLTFWNPAGQEKPERQQNDRRRWRQL